MWVVTIKPIAGVRSTAFVFQTLSEAEEFASCIDAQHRVETYLEKAGEPQEVFESWSW